MRIHGEPAETGFLGSGFSGCCVWKLSSGERRIKKVTVHAGNGLAQFFGGKLTFFALRANAEILCLTVSNLPPPNGDWEE